MDLADPEDIKVTVNDAGGTVLVHLGSSDFLERYKLYATHIGEWRHEFAKVQSVDMRYEGQIVVNPDVEKSADRANPPISGVSGMPADHPIAPKPPVQVGKSTASRGRSRDSKPAPSKESPTPRQKPGAKSQKPKTRSHKPRPASGA